MTDQYVQLRLEVLKTERLPVGARNVVQLLDDWGFTKEPQECLWVIAYDAQEHLRTVVEVSRGGHAEMHVHIQPLLTAVLNAGAIAFTIVHNHPTLTPAPSMTDWDLTQKVMAASDACGLVLEEHLIITPTGEYYSFREAGLILPLATPVGGKPLRAATRKRKS